MHWLFIDSFNGFASGQDGGHTENPDGLRSRIVSDFSRPISSGWLYLKHLITVWVCVWCGRRTWGTVMKHVAIYLRVSTSKQDTDNQRRELEAVPSLRCISFAFTALSMASSPGRLSLPFAPLMPASS